MKNASFVLDLTALFVALTALLVACQANNLTVQNERKMRRLECYDKIDHELDTVVRSYQGAIVNATRVHNYSGLSAAEPFSDFQVASVLMLNEVNNIKQVSLRYEFSCPQKVIDVFQQIENLASLRTDVNLSKFSKFTADEQGAHRLNYAKIRNTDIANLCCEKTY